MNYINEKKSLSQANPGTLFLVGIQAFFKINSKIRMKT